MITRIVKLHFQVDKIEEFVSFFDEIKEKVSNYNDCFGMRLLQEKDNESCVFTYSNWKNEEALNTYRDSALFQSVWSKIKPWFASKAEAWTTEVYFEGGIFSSNDSIENNVNQ